MNKLKTLEHLYFHELAELYGTADQTITILPQMVMAAHSAPVQDELKEYLNGALWRMTRVYEIFERLGECPTTSNGGAIAVLVREGESLLEAAADSNPEALEAALLAAGQRMELCQLAEFQAVVSLAKQLQRRSDLRLLRAGYTSAAPDAPNGKAGPAALVPEQTDSLC
jgi:ferritin-like metal-binding protein YciE